MLRFKFFFALLILFFCSYVYSLGQIINISPQPQSKYNNPETKILISFDEAINEQEVESKIRIYDSKGSLLDFTYHFSNKNKNLLIDPVQDFELGERISVSLMPLKLENKELTKNQDFSFFIKKYEATEKDSEAFKESELNDNFPSITINVNNNPADGKIFFHNLSALATDNDRFYGILNSDGTPFFAKQDNNKGLNFTLQKNGYISFWNNKSFYMMDSSYQVVDSFACENGYTADWHEFQMTEDNHAFLLAWDVQMVNMSEIVTGGQEYATVEGLIIQEFDENNNLIFQWRSWDHFEITDAEDVDFTTSYVSYVHGNALEIDTDGNLLLSSRLMNEITKIDRNTGDIIWRLGGKNNEFTFINDEGFCRQHDVRRIENGNITLFDNGVCHTPQISRAKEYTLDEVNKTATLVWKYEHPKAIFCETMGNVQRLSNGNTFINWGELPDHAMTGDDLWPAITEVNSNKEIKYELTFNKYFHMLYRSHKFIWDVNPPTSDGDFIFPKHNDLKLYPNPCSDILELSFSYSKEDFVKVTVLNLNGVKIKQATYNTCVGENHISINTNNIPSGLYVVKLEASNLSYYKMLSIIN